MIISAISMISTVGMSCILSRMIGSSMASASCMTIGMSACSMSGSSMVRKTCRE